MDVSPTGYVILGLLSLRPMSGYEIKAFVDKTVRFFWAASYGQIYPQLRALADAGLVAGEAKPAGGRRRTVFSLTDEGRERLREWLAVEPDVLEMRDEGLLKLFFADAADPATALEILDAKRRHHLEMVERLREIEPHAAAAQERFPGVVAGYGIECNQWMADWCERAAGDLRAVADAAERKTG